VLHHPKPISSTGLSYDYLNQTEREKLFMLQIIALILATINLNIIMASTEDNEKKKGRYFGAVIIFGIVLFGWGK
jgi:hypothetical protein